MIERKERERRERRVSCVLNMVKAGPREAQPISDLNHCQFFYFLKDWLGF